MTEDELSKYMDQCQTLWPVNTVIRRQILLKEYEKLTLPEFQKIVEKSYPSDDDGLTLKDIFK